MIPIKLTNDTWPPKDGEFCSSIVLYYDNWNDYSYRTSFVMCYCDADGMVREVGNVKIYYWQNDEVRTIAFLLVSPAGSENVFGGSPSVVWNSVQVNYLQEGKQLESLLQEIRKYIMSSIDKKGDSIAQEYCNCTREELLSFGEPPFKIATTKDPQKKR